jgi:hypothetical protein
MAPASSPSYDIIKIRKTRTRTRFLFVIMPMAGMALSCHPRSHKDEEAKERKTGDKDSFRKKWQVSRD